MKKGYHYILLITGLLFIILPEAYSQLPVLKLKDISGKTVDVSRLTENGKPVIISFFATWCKPCMNELNAIHEVYPDWQKETGVTLFIVSIDKAQDISKVKPLVDSNEWEYEVLLDPTGQLKKQMNVNTIPHIFIVDPKGKIVYNHSGYTQGSETVLLNKLREIKTN